MLSGKIVHVDLDGKGNEQRGIHRAIILKYIQGTSLAIVVPLTSNVEVYNKFGMTHYIRRSAENGLTTDSVAQVFQINSALQHDLKKIPLETSRLLENSLMMIKNR